MNLVSGTDVFVITNAFNFLLVGQFRSVFVSPAIESAGLPIAEFFIVNKLEIVHTPSVPNYKSFGFSRFTDLTMYLDIRIYLDA